jgi:hypothetical protein
MAENGIINSFVTIFERDLIKLEQEIGLYDHEPDLWKVKGDIKNAPGNLAMHLCGNLQHYIGAVLGNSGYTRDRENEFSAKDIPKGSLIQEIRMTRNRVRETLTVLDLNVLDREYPAHVFDFPMTTSFFLIHLAGHLNYHLGQINYHRRMIRNS